MTFDINEFSASINRYGIAKAENFSMNVNCPGGVANDERELMMRIETTDLPGRDVVMYESNYNGLSYKIAKDSLIADVNIQILLSEKFQEKEYMERWQDLAIGSYRNGQINKNMFNLNYYKKYVGTVVIQQYDETGQVTYTCKLVDAFPKTIGAIQNSWDNSTTLLKLPVTITYRYYVIEKERIES